MRFLLLAAALIAIPLPAIAQPSSGPMTLERIHNGFSFGGDAKVTKVDDKTSELVGGQAGWLFDDSIFIGGGGYWLANNSRDRRMGYGGLVVQWLTHPSDRFGYGVKGLIGGGEATLADSVTFPVPVRTGNRFTTESRTSSVRFRRDFFVAEPEANVFFRLTDHVRVTGGVGYRLVASEGRDDDRLRGATGTVGFQIF
jgi:hypothetical protein